LIPWDAFLILVARLMIGVWEDDLYILEFRKGKDRFLRQGDIVVEILNE